MFPDSILFGSIVGMLDYHVHLPLSKLLQRLLKLSATPSLYNIKHLTDGPKEV
jgi:hypothetical protein